MYATIDEARAAGATGTDEQIVAALLAARKAIDRYTADVFAPTLMTVVARPAPDGTTQLPYRVRSVSAVRPVGAATDLPTSSYLVTSSEIPGQIDAVMLGHGSSSDILRLGAEPWNGGYRGLVTSFVTGQVSVTGMFGPDETPTEVSECAALYAAHLRDLAQPGPGFPGALPDTDDEGNVVVITVSAQVRRAPTTGHELVDALLSGFVRQRIEFA